MRWISSTGIEAAPVTASRRLERSKRFRSGCARIDWYNVGGPGSTLMRSRATRSSTAGTSKTACGSAVAPRIRHASQPAL
jgi:hypothetical protein